MKQLILARDIRNEIVLIRPNSFFKNQRTVTVAQIIFSMINHQPQVSLSTMPASFPFFCCFLNFFPLPPSILL